MNAIAMLAGSGEPGLACIADSLALWLAAGDGVKLEAALGVPSNWRSAWRRRRRDQLYQQIASMCFPDLAGQALARAITTAISRYASSAWSHDRENGRRPSGTNELLYDLLTLGERLLNHEALRKSVGKNPVCEYLTEGAPSTIMAAETNEREHGF